MLIAVRKKTPQISIDPWKILHAFGGPGLFVTGVNTDIGKTTVTAALAGAFARLGIRVGICKPVAAGCPKHPDRGGPEDFTDDDLLSPDAEISMNMIGLNPRDLQLLAYASPIRFAAPVSPHLAARIEERPLDWRRVAAAMEYWRINCDFLLVEAAGGWMSPLDDNPRLFTVADLTTVLKLPVVVVTGTYMGTLGQTLLLIESVRARQLPLVGLVVNQVGPSQDLSVNTALDELPRITGLPVLAALPKREKLPEDRIPEEFVDLLAPFARYYYQSLVRKNTRGSRRSSTVSKAKKNRAKAAHKK
jgi:dethiobiotin synthetase